MKFLHTADWQIGLRAAHVGEAAARVRAERLASARRVMDAAREAGVEFVILAGDTFEDNGVDRVLVQRVADVLAAFGGPVYVLPGNHDPLVPGSVWDHPALRGAGNVTVLRDRAAVAVPGGALYPCPALAKHSSTDPTAGLDVRRDPGIRVAIAHGTLADIQHEEDYFPIARDAAARTGVDYLALGHWHSTALYTSPDGGVRMAYPGTHEPTRFGERDSGNALIVEIDAPGAPPRTRTVPTASLRWNVITAHIRERGDLSRVRADIEALADAGRMLLEVRLEGVLPAEEHEELVRIGEVLESRFVFGRIKTHSLRPSPEDDRWLARLPAGAVRQAAERLRALADPEHAGPRPDGASADVAAWALMELYEIARESAG